jgi:hypothetical protein
LGSYIKCHDDKQRRKDIFQQIFHGLKLRIKKLTFLERTDILVIESFTKRRVEAQPAKL